MATSITADAQFAPDSSLEETGFELPVLLTPTPLRAAKITWIYERCL
jgi:hypothetical protein